jgi:hypothetical protein
LKYIRIGFTSDKVLYSKHAREEMINEEFGRIFDRDVENAVFSGEIIETYPEDKPYPSILLLGFSNSKPIHIVCAVDEAEGKSIIITVYRPDPELWIDYRKRKMK